MMMQLLGAQKPARSVLLAAVQWFSGMAMAQTTAHGEE